MNNMKGLNIVLQFHLLYNPDFHALNDKGPQESMEIEAPMYTITVTII